jgi:threonine aldolase
MMIDFRSDTVTQPSQEMKQAMLAAPLGDDVYGDDPSVNALEQRLAELSGLDAALLVPSGTQSNLIALLSHCQRGDEYIVGQGYHSYLYEAGGAAVLGSIQPQPIAVEKDGSLSLEKVRQAIKPNDSHFAKSTLLALENTHNGKAISLDYLKQAQTFVKTHQLKLHLDGARIFNAMTELGCDLNTICSHVDSISICFSKGLGTPIGSVLCGNKEFIEQGRRWRKMLGGGMRQAGMLASAMHYALDHNVERLAIDHQNARYLAEQLSQFNEISVKPARTNMVFATLADEQVANRLAEFLTKHGVLISTAKELRLVTHLNITKADIDTFIALVNSFYNG